VPASAAAVGGLAVASGSAAAAAPAAIKQYEINAVQNLRIMFEPPNFIYRPPFTAIY
jgi:hypothetical protein